VLALVVFARDRPHHLLGHRMEELDALLGLRFEFEIDHRYCLR